MNYKSYEKKHIGSSDIASLTLRFPSETKILNFGGDGSYHAYIVDENAEIGSHYTLEVSGNYWLKIYDDNGLSFEASAEEIRIYSAGSYGCIIQLINKE